MIRQSLVKSTRVTIWSLATLTASAALATIFVAMSMDVGQKMTASLRTLGANAVVHPRGRSELNGPSKVNPGDWAHLQELARKSSAGLLELRLRVGTVEGAPVPIVSADPAALTRMTPYWAITGKRAFDPAECVMGRRLADLLGASAGNSVEVRAEGAARPERYRIAGVFESGDEDEGRIFVSSDPPAGVPRFEYALVSVPRGEAGIEALGAALEAAGAALEITPLRQVLHGERDVVGRIDLLIGVALLAVLLLSAVGVTAAVLARVIERRKELALLRAIGATGRSVTVFLLLEGAVVGSLAAVLGYVLGTGLSRAIVRQVFGVSLEIHAAPFIAAAGVSVLIAVAAAAFGAMRALRMETAVLLKGE
jgi:putative ABC transport system permease protein